MPIGSNPEYPATHRKIDTSPDRCIAHTARTPNLPKSWMDEPRHTLTEKAWLLAPIIFILTFIVFLPALSADFVNWDDDKNFTDNLHYRGLGPTQIQWMWTTHHLGAYVPISWMTLGLDYLIWGMEPFGYHLTSLMWHCANAVLLYFIALALFGRSPPAILGATFTALVFAIHPLRAESVVWVTERRDVVSGFFYLAAILLYLKCGAGWKPAADCQSASPGVRDRRASAAWWACLACFTVAVFAKVMAVTLPAILLLLDLYPLRRFGKRALLEKLPFFAISVVGSALAFYALRHDGLTSMAELGWFQRILIAVYGFAFYLWKTIVPVHLSPFYAITPHRLDPAALRILASLALVIAILAAAILLRRRPPAFTVAAAAYAITLLPVVGIFHNGQQIAADRYSYLPCLAWAILAGACVMVMNKRAIAVLAAALVATLGALTWRQTAVWHDSDTLWTHALAVEPSFIAWNNMGMVRSTAGDNAGAIDDYQKSIALNPAYALSHNNLGGALLVLEDWDAAIREFQLALKLKPDLANSHHGWGYALVMLGKLDEGIAHIQTALKLSPDYETARKTLDWAVGKKSPRP
jgi:tetratricopeptide (TPR) repeat protein